MDALQGDVLFAFRTMIFCEGFLCAKETRISAETAIHQG